MKRVDHTLAAAVLTLADHPGMEVGHTEGPWRLYAVKYHRFFREDRPLTPEFNTARPLAQWIHDHSGDLNVALRQFYTEGFDHGAGVRLPEPPERAQGTVSPFTLHDRMLAFTRLQEAARRQPVHVAVDLRELEELGATDVAWSEFLIANDDDAVQLTLGPVRVLLTYGQVRDVLLALLHEYLGEPWAQVMLTIADRLPGTIDPDVEARVTRALWLAVYSYRDQWPNRRGGYDDRAWGVDPPPGVTMHLPLGEDEFYSPGGGFNREDELSALRRLRVQLEGRNGR